MRAPFDNLAKFALALGDAFGRAALNTFNGFIISAAICYVCFFTVTIVGITIEDIIHRFGFAFSHILNLVYFIFFTALEIVALGMMFFARFIPLRENDKYDKLLLENIIDLMFVMYGIFVACTVAQIYFYYIYDNSIFVESDVGFFRIVGYVLELTFIGFIPDVIQYKQMEPSLTAVGYMHIAQFFIKIIMAITVISGTFRYIENRHKLTISPF